MSFFNRLVYLIIFGLIYSSCMWSEDLVITDKTFKYYAVDNVKPEDISLVKNSLGELNMIIRQVDCTDFDTLDFLIKEAEKNQLELIIWPTGYGHQWTPWYFSNGEWDISEGHKFLDYIESYLINGGKAINSILMTHEPFWNDGNPFSSNEIKELYGELKNYAPNTRLFTYINSLSLNENECDNVYIENGLGDIVGIWWHRFGTNEGNPTVNQVVKAIKDDIEIIETRNLDMEIVFAIQNFGWHGDDYYMPTVPELNELTSELFKIKNLDGIIWYSWDNYEVYDECLKYNRLDKNNRDRWAYIRGINLQ